MNLNTNKTLPMAYGFIGAAAFWALAHSGPAIAQVGGSLPAFLRLQPSTPGIQQTGHANISGTATVGGIKMSTGAGNGKVLTSDASGAASWQNAGSFLLPFAGTGSAPVNQNLFSVTNTGEGDAIYGSANGINSQGVKGSNNATSGFAYGVWGTTQSPGGSGIRGTNLATLGGTGVIGQANNTDGVGVSGLGYIGGKFESTSTNGVGVQGLASAASGNNRGVQGIAYSSTTNSSGVHGVASSPTGQVYGVYGETLSDGFTASGVYGRSSVVNGGHDTYGVFGESLNSLGSGVFGLGRGAGVRGEGTAPGGVGFSTASSFTGVSALASFSGVNALGGTYGVIGSATDTSQVTYGGHFSANSPVGYGVYAINNSATGGALGGYFTSASPDSRALFGIATASSGITYGTLGQSNSSSGGYGVWGLAQPSGWAFWAQGRLGASGTKSFCIDHPLDPENKYLLHYSTESPTPQNFYSGNVTTGADGKAWVELPTYFAEVNKNFKYQLTVLDDADSAGFVMAKVSKEVRGNKFQVRTSQPNVKVSWRVEADRNDRWVQRYGAPAQQDKDEFSRGTYLQPELYGQPKEKGLFEARLSTQTHVAKRP